MPNRRSHPLARLRHTIASSLIALTLLAAGGAFAGGFQLGPIPDPPEDAERRRAAIQRTQRAESGEQHAFFREGRFVHPESGLFGRVDESGSVRIGEGGAAGWTLRSFGRPSDKQLTEETPASFDGRSALIDRGALVESYENGALGLLQRIRLFDRPEGEGELRLLFGLDGFRAVDPELATPSSVLVDAEGVPRVHVGEVSARDARGEMLAATLTSVGNHVAIRALDDEAVFPIEIEVVAWAFGWRRTATLAPAPFVERPEYGYSVDLQGVWAAVSSPSHAVEMWNRLTYLFGDLWERTQTLTPRSGAAPGQFAVRVALGGGRLAIGAPWSDGAGVDLGYVDVYELDPSFGDWVYETTLTPADVPPGGSTFEFGFGRSLDVDGAVLVVGANRYWGGRGLVFLYERSGSTWSQVGVLQGTPHVADANFGDNVHVSGDTLAITQPGAGVMLNLPGQVVLYRRIAGVWTHEQTLEPGQGSGTPDDFGGAAALDGDGLAVRSSDALRAYTRSGSAWTETWSSAIGGIRDRYAMGLGGGRLVVGSSDTEVSGTAGAGSAGLFAQQLDDSFAPLTTFTPSPPTANGRFGFATALEGTRVIVGEPGAERAFVYRRTTGLVVLP